MKLLFSGDSPTTHLRRHLNAFLLPELKSGKEDAITVARNGKPVVKIVLIDQAPVSRRIGIAKGKFKAPDDFDAAGKEAAAMLMGGTL